MRSFLKQVFAWGLGLVVLTTGLYGPASKPAKAEEQPQPVLDFSVGLLKEFLPAGEKNPLLSPLSAWFALGMAAEGAGSETLLELTRLLGLPREELAGHASALMSGLADVGGSTRVEIANAGWMDPDISPGEDFLARIRGGFEAEIFEGELSSMETVEAMNRWVREKTGGLIPALHEGLLPRNAVAVLLNALYFGGRWQREFKAENTRPRDFMREDGTAVAADFLNDWECYRERIVLEGAEGILLPYDDGRLAFLALRPTDGRSVRDFARSLDGEGLKAAARAAETTLLDFAMPKFTRDFSGSLAETLGRMGLVRAFDMNLADFGPLGSSRLGPVFISDVRQKTRIQVNEKGTEAAAVTELNMAAGAAPLVVEPVPLVLDSPFVYAVVDLEGMVPLFLGILDDPSVL